MPRLVLHLGLPRTGTTSIQAFLAARRDTLRDHGVLYPAPSGATPQHRNFESAALNRDAATAVNHVGMAMELLDTERNLTDRAGSLPEWTAALDRMETEALETLIVSYENLGLTPRKYDLSRLEARLTGYERTGILYLRHPQDWLVSLYEQHIRGKRRGTTSFGEFGQFERAGALTSARRLRSAKRAFALTRLIPIDFTAAARDGGLIPSFVAAAGLAEAVACDDAPHRNASFPTWQTMFLRECNRRGVSDQLFVWLRRTLTVANRAGQRLVELEPGLALLTVSERAMLEQVAAADVTELHETTGLRLLGPKATPDVPPRPFTDADFTAVLAALRSVDRTSDDSPGLDAELAALAG